MAEGIVVNVDNFVRAESDRMLAGLQAEAGAVNTLAHRRVPADVTNQPVIRMNRDTLYSFAVIDLAADAVLTLPDAGERYVSAMIVSQDHYIHEIVHGPTSHVITQERTCDVQVLQQLHGRRAQRHRRPHLRRGAPHPRDLGEPLHEGRRCAPGGHRSTS